MLNDFNFWKDISNLFLTLVLAVATILLAIYTIKLVVETRMIRKADAQPLISLHLEEAETDVYLQYVIVRNIGKGPAYDLKFHIQKDIGNYGDESTKLSVRGIFKEGMKFCPPGYSKRYFLIHTLNNYEKKMLEELILIVHYKMFSKKKR